MKEPAALSRLFDEAFDKPPAERAAFLDQVCAGDDDLRRRLESLLAAADRARTEEVLPPLAAGKKLGGGDLVGQRVHNYELVAPLGEGGMGVVYRARHLFFPREAAIKVLHEHLVKDGNTVQRFLNEARAANAIKHPNIIEVYDVGLMPSSTAPYLVLEYLHGENLRARLDRLRRLTLAETLEIAAQTMAALGAAHAGGIIHRDLKPENLFLVARPAGIQVKVLDFGIAKLHTDLVTSEVHTATGAVVGTPRYMSPEQCRGHGLIDRRSDIYSLGVILYEMLCGRPPFVSEGMGEVIFMHIGQPPPAPRLHNPEIPARVEAAILQALAKDPSDRFADMTAFGAALGAPWGAVNAPSAGEGGAIAKGASSSQSTLDGAAKQAVTQARPQRRSLIAAAVGALAVAGSFLWLRRATVLESPSVVAPGSPGERSGRASLDVQPAAVVAVVDAAPAMAEAPDAGRGDAQRVAPKKRKRVTFEPTPW